MTTNTEVHSLIDTIWFTKAIYVDAHYALEAAICCYADQRVAPHWIVSLKERLADGYERYKNRPKYQSDNFQESVDALYRLEDSLFNCIDLDPFDISVVSCRSIISELRSFDISS